MKVTELIQLLYTMPAGAEVHFQYNYGDYWKTQVAPTIDRVELGKIKFSNYHNMHMVVEEDESDGDQVVIIS
jgi:hypothetical protein